jgi:ABC-type oligopeptide transport system substrate-binding subunit
MRLFLILLALSLPFSAQATEQFGIAMVGAPKYNAQSTHLDYVNPDAPKGGILKQSATGSFDTLNPYNIKGRAAQGLNLTTDRLMARVWDEPFTLYPLIAKKIDVPEDRSEITFTLNPKARFHDGSPITTEDVLFTYKTLKEKGRPNQRRIYKMATPTVVDKHTIKFTLGEGHDRETAMIFGLMPVLSKAYWKDKEFDKTTLEAPLGSGPYKIQSAEAGKRIVYERVEDYWAQDLLPNKGHHNFDEIIYEYYRDDTVALESFKKGDLSIRREWDAGNWNAQYDFDAIKEEIKHGRAEKVRGFIFNTRRSPFDDIKVRHALNNFFDFDWMNKNLFYGAYEQVNSFYPNTYLSYKKKEGDKLSLRERMREGNKLLKEAGWAVKDGKRVHEETGEVMVFDILLDNPSDEKIALALTRSLKKMGIEANVRVLDSAAYRARLNDYDFDMILHYWHSTLSPGTEQYLYWSCEAAETQAQWNYAGICDTQIDALAKSIPTAKTREELIQNTQKLDQKLQNAALMIPLYYNPVDYVAYREPLKRPETTPLYGMVIETWWMDQEGNDNKD